MAAATAPDGRRIGRRRESCCRHWHLSRPPSTLRLKVVWARDLLSLLLRSDFCRSRSLRVRKDPPVLEMRALERTDDWQASNNTRWTVPPPLSIGARSSTVVTPQRTAETATDRTQASPAMAVGCARTRRRQCRARSGPVRRLRRWPNRSWSPLGRAWG